MSYRVKLDPTNRILARRKLQKKNGEAQVFFTKQCAKYMNNYVPFDTGRLKDMSVTMGTNYVKYDTPYAKKQYYTNSGNGIRNRSGLRGKLWDRRMWNDKKNTIVQELANFIGGRVR